MGRKTVVYKPDGIEKLPENKPVIYRIETVGGNVNSWASPSAVESKSESASTYPVGKDHVPGSKVRIEQMPSIKEALKKEEHIIARSQPPYNEQGK